MKKTIISLILIMIFIPIMTLGAQEVASQKTYDYVLPNAIYVTPSQCFLLTVSQCWSNYGLVKGFRTELTSIIQPVDIRNTNIGSISAFRILIKGMNTTNGSTQVKFYQGSSSDPASAQLVDSFLYQNLNTSEKLVTFQLDTDLTTIDPNSGTQLVNFVFIETTTPDVSGINFIGYSFGLITTINSGETSTYVKNSIDVPNYISSGQRYCPYCPDANFHKSMYYIIYGNYHFPTTPKPTETGTPQPTQPISTDNPGLPPFYPGTGEGYNATFLTGSDFPCDPVNESCVEGWNGSLNNKGEFGGNGTLIGDSLSGMGYDYNNDGQITWDEFVQFIYDMTTLALILSFFGIFITRKKIGQGMIQKRRW